MAEQHTHQFGDGVFNDGPPTRTPDPQPVQSPPENSSMADTQPPKPEKGNYKLCPKCERHWLQARKAFCERCGWKNPKSSMNAATASRWQRLVSDLKAGRRTVEQWDAEQHDDDEPRYYAVESEQPPAPKKRGRKPTAPPKPQPATLDDLGAFGDGTGTKPESDAVAAARVAYGEKHITRLLNCLHNAANDAGYGNWWALLPTVKRIWG